MKFCLMQHILFLFHCCVTCFQFPAKHKGMPANCDLHLLPHCSTESKYQASMLQCALVGATLEYCLDTTIGREHSGQNAD